MKCFRRLFIFLALGIFFTLQNLRATETNSVLDSWFAAQKNIQTWSADFTQTRTFKTLTQPLIGKGHVWFSAPNDFRWELGKPVRTIALRRGDEMFIIYPRLKRAEKYSMGVDAPEQLRDAMSLLNAGFPRSREAFDSQYKILSLAETNGDWQLNLQPKNPGAQQMISELQIGLAANNFSLASTELVFADGSRMQNDFTNVVLNPKLDKKLFEWTPPPDYQVVNPFAK